MGTTKRELVYRLWRKLENGNIPDDSRFTYRELSGYISSGIAFALKSNYFEQRNLEDFKYGDSDITASYKAEVKFDDDKQQSYIDLQGKTISIAGNRFTTINSASMVDRNSTMYIPIRLEEVFVGRNSPEVPCVVMFYKEGGKAWFFNQEVRDKEVIVSDRYSIPQDDNVEMDMPSELENQVLAQALQLILNSPIQADRQNDGISK